MRRQRWVFFPERRHTKIVFEGLAGQSAREPRMTQSRNQCQLCMLRGSSTTLIQKTPRLDCWCKSVYPRGEAGAEVLNLDLCQPHPHPRPHYRPQQLVGQLPPLPNQKRCWSTSAKSAAPSGDVRKPKNVTVALFYKLPSSPQQGTRWHCWCLQLVATECIGTEEVPVKTTEVPGNIRLDQGLVSGTHSTERLEEGERVANDVIFFDLINPVYIILQVWSLWALCPKRF